MHRYALHVRPPWHGDQLQRLASANRAHVGGARRGGMRLRGCLCHTCLGVHLVTAHTFDGRHPTVEQVATMRRRFAASRHSMSRTSGLRRLGGHLTSSLLIACRNYRRPPAMRPRRRWRTSGR